MREVLRGFRMKVRGIEDRAGIEIDRIMARPTLIQGNLQQLNAMIIKETMARVMEAVQEGGKCGSYIASKT